MPTLIGICHLHTAIDDHSRVACVEAHDDETKETATAIGKVAPITRLDNLPGHHN